MVICRLLATVALGSLLGCSSSGGDDTVEPDSLFARVGGKTGVEEIAADLVDRTLADPRINGYFLNSSVDAARRKKCLTIQLGAAAGGPYTYPDPEAGCRSMKKAHDGLGISRADFDDWMENYIAVLAERGLSADDIDAMVTPLQAEVDSVVSDPESDLTVYQRVGRKPAIMLVVDNFVGRVAADVRINTFFDAAKLPRLKTCLVRQVCSIDGPCKYGEAIGTTVGEYEPGVGADSVCEPMGSAHNGLEDENGSPITIEDFNALVEDLVLEVDAAGVAPADRDALLGALGPLCPDIVADPDACGT